MRQVGAERRFGIRDTINAMTPLRAKTRVLSIKSARDGYAHLLNSEIFAQIDAPHIFVLHNILGGAGHQNLSIMQDIGAVNDFQRLAHVVIRDQNVRETLEIVDRAYILHDGQVLMSGTPQDVVQNENVRRVYLGENFRIQ